MSGNRLSSGTVRLEGRSGPDGVVLLDGSDAQHRILQLEREVTQLREGLVARERVGIATGLVAERLGLSPDHAFALLRAVSQNRNVKLREVARIVVQARNGQLAEKEGQLAEELHYLIFGQCDGVSYRIPGRP